MKERDLAALFARSLLGGKIEPLNLPFLNASQDNCAAQLLAIVNVFGGALLADPVGSGKTRIAIAVAAHFRSQPSVRICVIAPARVRTHWILEAKNCGGIEVEFYSHAFLSQNKDTTPTSDFIIVDEAHRFRNPKAKRSRHLELILDCKPCLLVSATPFVNREMDLINLIRYFLDDEDARKRLGIDPEKANQADLKSMLHSLCVRRGYEDIPDLVTSQIAYNLSDVELAFLHQFSTAMDSLQFEALKHEWPAGLVRHFLAKQFHYGLVALQASLNSITQYCEQWLFAAEQKLGMNRRFFSESFPNGQLPFSFMYPEDRLGDLGKVESDLEILRSVLETFSYIPIYSRNEAIVRACKTGEKTLIFTSRIPVAESLFKHFLKENYSVGIVHSQRSSISGIGEVETVEVVGKFRNMVGLGHEKISILIATDCLAEGVSFPECSNLILVDTPDTAVKIEQRIGRIVRLNSLFKVSNVYRLKPTNLPEFKLERSSDFARRKSERSTQIGFRYALAANLLGAEKNTEGSFSVLLECREILARIGENFCIRDDDSRFFVATRQTNISSLTLARFLEGDKIFSYHWTATLNGKLTTSWSDIQETVLQLSRSIDELRGCSDFALSPVEKKSLDQLIIRRNLTRFLPSPKQKNDSISRALKRKISGFALSSSEISHINQILYLPLSRGRRLRMEALSGKNNVVVLKELLEMKVFPFKKLVCEVVFSLRFRE